MTTWFKADRWSNTIKTVEVLSETKAYITLAPAPQVTQKTLRTFLEWYYNREPSRVSKGKEYYPTFAEARKYLMEFWNNRNEASKREAWLLLQEAEQAHVKWSKVFVQEGPDANSNS